MTIIQAAPSPMPKPPAVDPVEGKRRLAVEMDASNAVEPEWLADLCGDVGDIAFEAVGALTTIPAAHDTTRRGGKTVIVGARPKAAAVASHRTSCTPRRSS
ncbi:zinc-binding dehydrogenase [Streptomyces acidicola]|uniref:zinc-binding dehydrogenase n=1 Tax=Streptomyces acidicola TaxID=2596892 RepID=UPI0034316C7D